MKPHHVAISGVVAAMALDIGREIVMNEAESLTLKAIRVLFEWIKNLFSPPQQQFGWYYY